MMMNMINDNNNNDNNNVNNNIRVSQAASASRCTTASTRRPERDKWQYAMTCHM